MHKRSENYCLYTRADLFLAVCAALIFELNFIVTARSVQDFIYSNTIGSSFK